MAASVEEQIINMDHTNSEATLHEVLSEAQGEKEQSQPTVDSSDSNRPDSSYENNTNLETASPVKTSPVKDKVTDNDFIYHVKWISRNGLKSPIITQNENGPCPLIAITNVLIMKGRITIPSLADFLTTENLMEYLGNCILESIPTNIPEGTQLNFEQNMHDAMAVLPKLQTGLDVNVKFTGISDFEYTPECIIFDLLRIPLYHGWLYDPQVPDVVSAVGKCSYNQLVEKIINSKFSTDADKVTEALVAESFLEKTASQLTYHGLYELTSKLKEDELCVLFRNNHFSSLIKHNNCLFQLVTDQGFLNENVVWETLNNIEGDGQFVDSSFVLVPPKCTDIAIAPNIPEDKQIDQDYLVALSLQEEQQKQQNNELEWEDFKKKKLGVSNGLSDEELARRLQAEELSEEDNPIQTPPPTQPSNNTRSSRNRDCVIL